MKDYGNVKKVVNRRIGLTALSLTCFLLFNFFLFAMTKFVISNFGNINKDKLVVGMIAIIVVYLFLIGIAYLLPYKVLKMYPKMTYFEDGFEYGNNGKTLYKDLDYFFVPNDQLPNTFLAIWYKNNDGTWKNIPAVGYPRNGFELFQQDFVKANYQDAMQKIEKGETLEFLYNDPKKLIMKLGAQKYIGAKLEQALKLKISKEALILDNQIYKWDEYNIQAKSGYIFVKDKNNNEVLTLNTRALIHKENLVMALIDSLSK